jgi:hypothetical protein
VLAWTNHKFQKIDETLANVTTHVGELKAEQESNMSNLESVIGHAVDANGDGRVNLSEAKQVVTELASGAAAGDPASKDALFDSGTFLSLLAALLGFGAAAKGGNTLLDKMKALKQVQNGNAHPTPAQ